jgi:hypothetical protein
VVLFFVLLGSRKAGMSIAARSFLLTFGVVYTGWSLWLVLMWRRTLFYPTEPQLGTSARRYRLRLYVFWIARVGIGCFSLAFAIFGPLSKSTMVLLFLPVALCFVLALLAALIWRKHYRMLRAAGLL